jgi:hypothetical protein
MVKYFYILYNIVMQLSKGGWLVSREWLSQGAVVLRICEQDHLIHVFGVWLYKTVLENVRQQHRCQEILIEYLHRKFSYIQQEILAILYIEIKFVQMLF